MGKYDDMLDLPRPRSEHAPMPRADRAKQFMPFAALKGYDEAIEEKQVIYVPRLELGEEQRDALDRRLLMLGEALLAGQRPQVTIEYFVTHADAPDQGAPLGQYHLFTGTAEKMRTEEGTLRISGQTFPLADVVALTVHE